MTAITVGSAQASYGDEVQIPVEIEKANKIGSMNLIIAYPKDVLEVVDVIQGSLTENSLFDYNVEDGKIKIGVSDTNGISGDGSLFYMKFRVMEAKEKESGGKESGRKRIAGENLLRLKEISDVYSISVEEADIYDVDGSQIKPLIINGTFEITSEEEANKGDVNGDGVINSLDALLALQMSIGKIEAKPVADMDGDGKVLAKDATDILKIATKNMFEQTKKFIELGIGK
nr:cohesin domain-containing protein [Archaeoglobus neptunius]